MSDQLIYSRLKMHKFRKSTLQAFSFNSRCPLCGFLIETQNWQNRTKFHQKKRKNEEIKNPQAHIYTLIHLI